MNDMYLFIVFAASAYVLQAVISWGSNQSISIKHIANCEEKEK